MQVEFNQVKRIKFVRKVSRIEPVSVIQCLDQDESSVYARPFDRMPAGYTLGYSLGRVASVLYILQVRGSGVPEPYQHTLKSLFVRGPFFRCGASARLFETCRKVTLCYQGSHTHMSCRPDCAQAAKAFQG